MPAISHPVRVLQHLGPSFRHCVCNGRNTISSGPAKRCQHSENLRAIQAAENREEEGCVYSIPLSDLIGKLLELNTSDQRERINIIDCPCSGRMKTFSFKTFVHK